MPSYEDDLDEFEGLNTQVLGISVDSIPSHEAWEKSIGGITYPLCSDFYPKTYICSNKGVYMGRPKIAYRWLKNRLYAVGGKILYGGERFYCSRIPRG